MLCMPTSLLLPMVPMVPAEKLELVEQVEGIFRTLELVWGSLYSYNLVLSMSIFNCFKDNF